MSRPSLSSLKTFEVVARLGSLRAAAEELHITQSAVSHQLRRLEDALEVQLLEKQGRGIRLTPQGDQLAEGLKEGFGRINAVVEALTNEQTQERLRINCLPSIAVRWLIPRLNRFRSRYPEYAINFQYIDISSSDVPPDIDVQITWFDGEPRGHCDKTLLFSGETIPVASPHYLQTVPPVTQPRDLLLLDLLHDETYNHWLSWFKSHGLNPNRLNQGLLYQDFNLLSSSAIAGQGVALCPPRLIEDELAQGTLVELFATRANTTRAYWLFSHPAPRPAVQRFIDWLIEEANPPAEPCIAGAGTASD